MCHAEQRYHPARYTQRGITFFLEEEVVATVPPILVLIYTFLLPMSTVGL